MSLSENVRLTTRRLTVNLDSSDSPLVINMTDRTISSSEGTIELPDTVRRIVTTGVAGNDEIFIVGSTGDDLARVKTNRVTAKGTDLFVLGRSFESVRTYGSAGSDRVILGNQNGLTFQDYGFDSATFASIPAESNGDGSVIVGAASEFGTDVMVVSNQERAFWTGQALSQSNEFGFDLDDEASRDA